MYTTVNLGRIDTDSTLEVSRLFGEFDKSGMNRLLGVRQRQLFRLSDLLIHTQDFDAERGQLDQSSAARATRFYSWQAAPAVTSGTQPATAIVGRMREGIKAEVCQIFEELDSTDVPHKMGTRSRQLYQYQDVYLHIQHFAHAGGVKPIDQAWRDADPRFIKACEELMAIIPPYDPLTWVVPTDSLATCFYRWEETT